jgi:UDP-glucuronate decarboxylase
LSPSLAPANFPSCARLLRPMHIVVTGGAGFIGSHIVDVLMTQGHVVTVVDNFFTGRKKNIAHWLGHPRFALVEADVAFLDVRLPIFSVIDQIYHLASPASPPHYEKDMLFTIRTNSDGTRKMLELAAVTNARLLFTSTSEVYGDPQVHPQPETYHGNVNTMGPRSCYDEGKRLGETLCYAYARQRGVTIRIARIFNTFGPRMHPDDGRVVSNFITHALSGKPLTIYGEGKQTRSFQYVSDLVAGLVALMNSDAETLQVPREGVVGSVAPFAVNLGSSFEMSVVDFAEKVRTIVSPENPAPIVKKEATQDDPHQRQADSSRAKALLGWQPQVSLDDGLRLTVAYFKEELGLSTKESKQIREDEPPLWVTTRVNKHLTEMRNSLGNNKHI